MVYRSLQDKLYYVIGDMVLFGLEEDEINIVGRPAVANWVQFNAETGGYDVVVERDERTVSNPRPRRTFRFELRGPYALALLEKLNGGPLADIKLFTLGEVRVAGRTLRALKHGMGGAPGLEFWRPMAQGPEVKAAILEAGREFGLRQVGARAYSSVAIESGWIPSPVPAIYAGEKMRSYRELLQADSFDEVVSNNETVGVSTYPAYTINEKAWLSLAVIDESKAQFGAEVTVIWGEQNGGSKKPVVERHVQKEIRATVSPWPFSKQVRESYRPRAR